MEPDFEDTLGIIPCNSGKHFASESSTPESAVTPTNSTWCINQSDSSDDVNNNNSNANANTNAISFVNKQSKKNRHSSSKDLSHLLLLNELSELRDETSTTIIDDHTLLMGCSIEEEKESSSFCDEFLGVREDVIHSVIGETFQAYPARKRCNSYIEHSDYEELNGPCFSDGGTSTTSFDVSESETDSPDQVNCMEIMASISALNGLTKEQVISESTAILQQLYEDNLLLRDQLASVEKLSEEKTETTKQLRYDLARKDCLLKELCAELEEKHTDSKSDKNDLNISRCELQEKVLQLQDENEAHKTVIDRLQAKKEKWKKQRKDYERQIKDLQDEVSNSEEDLKKHTEECQKDENNMKELLNTIKDLKIVIRHLTYENLELSETINALKDSKDSTIEDELRKERDKCDELQEQLAKAREEQRKTFSCSLNNLDTICDSDDSLFSQLSESVGSASELPPSFTSVPKRTKTAFHPPRQRRLSATRRRATSLCENSKSLPVQGTPSTRAFQEIPRARSFQDGHKADEQNMPKMTSLFSGTSILNRVGLLVMGLGALGAGTVVDSTNFVTHSSLDMGKPGTPGSGDLEYALTRLSSRQSEPPSAAMTVFETSDINSACVSSVSATPKLGHQDNALSSAPVTASIFRYMGSMAKPTCSVTSSCGLKPVFYLENNNNNTKKRHSMEGISPLTFLSTMRGTMPLSKNSVTSSSSSDNYPEATSEKLTSSQSCSDSSDNGETRPTTTPQIGSFMRTRSYQSVFGALNSFRRSGKFE